MREYDVIIIGGGPAGLTCGTYCSRAGLRTLVLQDNSSQLLNIPHIENYPGIGEISGMDLLTIMEDQACNFGCDIGYLFAESIRFDWEDMRYRIINEDDEECVSPSIVLATGASHKKLGVPGEVELEGRGVSYCAVCDGPFFKDKKILVVGGGDSACQEAIYLTSFSNNVTICHRRDSFRAQRTIVDKMISSGVKTQLNSNISEIYGDGRVEGVVFEDGTKEKYDAVFIFVGMEPREEILWENILPPERDHGFYKVDEYMRTTTPGIYAIGDARVTSLRQIVTACSDGAIAANAIKNK